MGFGTYRSVLSSTAVRRVLLLSFLIRIPMWAGNVILTLHVVAHLGRSYGAAGLVAAAATVALSVSAPWRGRRLDRVGLRRTVAPSLVVLTACWCVAPFVGYWPLLGLASLAGLFVVPTFSIVRQALMAAVADDQRRSALAVDSVVIELSFMVGPALGVVLATAWSTPWAMLTCELASVLGGLLLYLVDPPLRAASDAADDATAAPLKVRDWLGLQVAAVLGMAAAATVVLSGTDVAVVAVMRSLHETGAIGLVLAMWGFGSALGGLVYGALRRPVPLPLLLGLLGATTLPVALAGSVLTAAVLLFVAGVFCAPTITATVDALSRAVPERARGEVMGWHGSAMTAGSAAGAPIAGVAVDRLGAGAGFAVTAVAGLVVAVAGSLVLRRGRPVGEVVTPADALDPTVAADAVRA